MHITIERDKNIAVVYVEKNIISEYVDEFEEQLSSLKDDNIHSFVFDFKNVEYMCSSALGLIASNLRYSSENEGVVYFTSMSKQLEELFSATKFLNIVNVADSSEKALQIIKG